jgi:hypothetical protein
MRLYQMLNSRVRGAPPQVVQERLIRIDGVNQRAEFLRKRQCLTTRPATCVDNYTELPFRKKPQNVQGMGIATWPELLHSSEKQFDRIVRVHRPPSIFPHLTTELSCRAERQRNMIRCSEW